MSPGQQIPTPESLLKEEPSNELFEVEDFISPMDLASWSQRVSMSLITALGENELKELLSHLGRLLCSTQCNCLFA